MTGTPKVGRRLFAALAAVGVVAWLFLGSVGPTGRIDLPAPGSRPKSVPLDCRVVPVGASRQWAILEEHGVFRGLPFLPTGRLGRNPLVADAVVIEVENTSGRELAVRRHFDGREFRVELAIRDERGNPVHYPRYPSGLKELGFLSADGAPVVRVPPGAVDRRLASIFPSLNAENGFPPGRYEVRAIARFHEAPDGREGRVESEPFRVTVTAADLRGWKQLRRARPPSFKGWLSQFF